MIQMAEDDLVACVTKTGVEGIVGDRSGPRCCVLLSCSVWIWNVFDLFYNLKLIFFLLFILCWLALQLFCFLI